MKKMLQIILFVFVSVALSAQTFNYLPANIVGSQVIEYSQFSISYNPNHKQADWVAYELTAEEVKATQERCDCFKIDKNISSDAVSSGDYNSSGFDKGHLCPAADCNISKQANEESFLMTNMSPQLPLFNRGIWSDLEEWVREAALNYSTIYVTTGPVFVNNLGTLSEKKITIPGHYYKTLLRFEGEKIKTIAFLIPHVGAVGKLKDYVVSVNTLETITGIDFYPELDDSMENKVESQIELRKWGL